MSEKIIDTAENVKMLNEKLGITSKENLFNSSGIKSITEMLENSKRDFELLCENIVSKKEEIAEAEKKALVSFDSIKETASSESEHTEKELREASLAISNFGSTIESMMVLIQKGDDIIDKLYDAIVHTDIVDPDLINATASVIHSIRESNDNLIQFNMQKMTLENQYKLAIDSEKLKQKHRLELEFFKHKLRQEELENKSRIKREEEAGKSVDVTVSDTNCGKSWSQSDIVEMIRKSES